MLSNHLSHESKEHFYMVISKDLEYTGLTWYRIPSGASCKIPTTPLEPAHEEGNVRDFSQNAPRPSCTTAGRRLVQLPEPVMS